MPPRSAPGPAEGASDSFTRMFLGADASKARPASPAPVGETTPLTRSEPGPASQPKGPGEFTRLFQAPQVEEKPPAAFPDESQSPPSSAPASQSAADATPGEFTLLFRPGAQAARSGGPPIPGVPSKPPTLIGNTPSRQGPGEFTQLFQGYQPGKSALKPPVLEQPEPVLLPSPPKVEETGPGEFTQIFRRPSDLGPPPPAAKAPPVVQAPPHPPRHYRSRMNTCECSSFQVEAALPGALSQGHLPHRRKAQGVRCRRSRLRYPWRRACLTFNRRS